MATTKPPPNALAFKRRLLAWFRREGRDLPWRRTRNPYHILVSEFMLQQTQVSRVTQYYRKFLDRYPTVSELAQATPKAVRETWDGLGYYRRAEHLHALAKTVLGDHGGRIPTDLEELRRLPGVGPYTAGAVSAFAYERPVAAVDTNVDRVLRRVFRPRQASGAVGSRKINTLATLLQPTRGRTAWEFNQALMDLGALLCTARSPACARCPVQPACKTGRRVTNPKG